MTSTESITLESISLEYRRRLRGSKALPPFVLCLENVHLPTANRNDKYHGYLNQVVHDIAASLKKSATDIQPTALLVFENTLKSGGSTGANSTNTKEYGSLVLLFNIKNGCGDDYEVCKAVHYLVSSAWSGVLSDHKSQLGKSFEGHIDQSFPHLLTAELCIAWKFQGPGCSEMDIAPAKPAAQTGGDGLPTWFYVIIIPAASAIQILCLYGAKMLITHFWALKAAAKANEPVLLKVRRERRNIQSIGADDVCPICLSKPSEDPKSELLMPPCGHYMHVCCAESWLAQQMQCPLCRVSIDAQECTVLELNAIVERDVKALPCVYKSEQSCQSCATSEVPRCFYKSEQSNLAAEPQRESSGHSIDSSVDMSAILSKILSKRKSSFPKIHPDTSTDVPQGSITCFSNPRSRENSAWPSIDEDKEDVEVQDLP